MIGISACLGGICCRYDGGTQKISELAALVSEQKALLICPEVLGGLSTPRQPAEIIGGDGFAVWQGTAKVVDTAGKDVTEAFKAGAVNALAQLQKLGINRLILKERSPSCGSQTIYDGSFSGTKITGVGVATALFQQNGLQVYSEENWQQALTES